MEDVILETELRETHDAVRRIVREGTHGTAGRTFPALVAQRGMLPGSCGDALGEGIAVVMVHEC